MRLRTIASATVAVSLGSTGAFAQDSGSFDARSAIESFLTSPGDVAAQSGTVGSITTDGDTVTANDVEITWSFDVAPEESDATATVEMVLSAPSVSITGLMFDGVYTAQDITVPSISFDVELSGAPEGGTLEMELTDYSIKGATWAPLPVIAENPAAPVSRFAPLINHMVSQGYDSATLGGMTGTLVAGEERQSFDYQSSTYGAMRDGVLESFTIGSGVTRQTLTADPALGPMPEELVVEYGETTGRTIDVKPFVALLTGEGASDGPQTFIGEMKAGSITASAGDQMSFNLGPTTLADLTIDPARGPLLPQIDVIVNQVADGGEPDVPNLINFMLNTYGAFGIGTYQLESMDVSFPGGLFKLGSFLLEGFSASGMETLALSGIEVQSPELNGSIGSAEMGDLVFPARDDFMAAMMASMVGTPPDPMLVMKAVPTVGRLALSDFDFDVPAMGNLALGLVELRATNYINAIPTQLSLMLDGLSVPAAFVQDPMAAGMITALGADPLTADGSITLGWSEGDKTVTLDKDLSIGQVGRLAISAQLSGIPQYIFTEPQRAQEALVTAAVDGLSARFEDAGITPFAINMIAQQSGMPAEQFPAIASQQAQFQLQALTGNAELADQVSSAVGAFLSDPQSLSISASPATAVPLAQIMGAVMTAPQALPELLSLSISANTAAQ